MSQANQLVTIFKINENTARFALELSEEDVKELILQRQTVLKKQGRVEFKEGIITKLIYHFCDSPYIDQNNYKDTLEYLQEIFYLYKNESLDELSDDELLEFMKIKFDGECEGSLEYLEGTILEEFARNIRFSTHKYIDSYLKGDE